MYRTWQEFLLTLVTTLAAGVLLHDFYKWFSYPIFGFIAPVNESIWEHVKIIFYPLLIAGFFQNKADDPTAFAAWQLSALISSFGMLLIAYIYHEVLKQDSFLFDIGLFAVTILLGNILPSYLYGVVGEPRIQRWIRLATYGMIFLIIGKSVITMRKTNS